jgi:hypothetical protein
MIAVVSTELEYAFASAIIDLLLSATVTHEETDCKEVPKKVSLVR